MTTPLQPATRRLLTEAAAAAGIGDPTHPLGAALDAMIDPLLDAKVDDLQAGVPNGFATLGPDGRVPAAQLPPAAAGPQVARLTTAFAWSVTTLTDIAGLALDLTPGVWLIEAAGSVYSSAGTVDLTLQAANGLVAPAGPTTTAGATANGGRFEVQYGLSGTNFSHGTRIWDGSWVALGATVNSGSFQPFRLRGAMTVTTAGRLQARGLFSNAGTSRVDAYTELRATKLS